MKIPGPAASHEKVLKLNSTAVVSLKTGKPVLKQLIMQPDNSLGCNRSSAWPYILIDLPGQFDVRPEGVWFPWTGHVTLELPKKVT